MAKARGQTVNFNAWGGDEKTNAFVEWAGRKSRKRYGVTVNHVKLKDTAEAVTRVVAEKAAGRTAGGSVDLIWLNGPNFLALKEQGLLFGPFTQALPSYAKVDTTHIRSNVVDFTVPVDGMEAPWRRAQIVFVYDGRRVAAPPRSVPELLAWAQRNPGRLTHPAVRNFLGATFLKQALYELAPDPAVLQRPATDDNFAAVTAPLWTWYDALRPLLWRKGAQFPENGPAQRQLLERRRDRHDDLVQSRGGRGRDTRGPAPGQRAYRRVRPRYDRQHELRRDPVQRGEQGRRDGRR